MDIESLAGLAGSDDPEVRGRVAAALGNADGPGALGVLVDLLADRDRRVRMAAVRSIGDLHDRNGVEPLLPLLEENDVELSCTVLAALAQIGDERSFAPIVARLFDVNDDIRKNAAAAAGPLRDARALEPLLMCLDDPVEWVRANSAWSLGFLDCAEAIGPLRDLADSRDTATVRANAVTALGQIGARGACGAEACAAALRFVLEVLDDLAEEPRVRVAALVALAQGFEALCASAPDIAGQTLALSLMLARSCEDDDLRSTAVWALGKTCDAGVAERVGLAPEAIDQALDALGAALHDPAEWCVRYAIEALAAVGGPRSREMLEAFASSDAAAPYAGLCAQALGR